MIGWLMLLIAVVMFGVAAFMLSRARSQKAKIASVLAAASTLAFGVVLLFGPPTGLTDSPTLMVLMLAAYVSAALAARWERRAEGHS